MGNMEYAIEQAARLIDPDGWRLRDSGTLPLNHPGAQAVVRGSLETARALAAAGLLVPAPPREEWSTYDANSTGMWGRTNFRADSEEQARELAFKFGYQVHHRFVSDGFKTDWEEAQ